MKQTKKIKIKYLNGAHPLDQIDIGDWIDLYSYSDIFVKTGRHYYISLGVAMELPEGYEAVIAPRSSTFKRWGVLQPNSPAVIDNSYCGDDDIWHFSAYATKDIRIPAGTRICQFRIQKIQPHIQFIPVEHLGNENRGGLGSTGA